jgi:hypothetical protein
MRGMTDVNLCSPVAKAQAHQLISFICWAAPRALPKPIEPSFRAGTMTTKNKANLSGIRGERVGYETPSIVDVQCQGIPLSDLSISIELTNARK